MFRCPSGNSGDPVPTMNTLIDSLATLASPWLYLVVAALAAAESAALVGLVLPGESALLIGGFAASQGHVSLPIMIATALVAAIAGDSVGYELGRRFGPRLRDSRVGLWVGEDRWAKAEASIERRGGPAVLVGRWVGLLRALVPGVAGMTRMPYRTFLLWNVLGAAIWAPAVVIGGYLAGNSFHSVSRVLGQASQMIALAAVVVAAVWLAARWAAAHRNRVEAVGRRLSGSRPIRQLDRWARSAAERLTDRMRPARVLDHRRLRMCGRRADGLGAGRNLRSCGRRRRNCIAGPAGRQLVRRASRRLAQRRRRNNLDHGRRNWGGRHSGHRRVDLVEAIRVVAAHARHRIVARRSGWVVPGDQAPHGANPTPQLGAPVRRVGLPFGAYHRSGRHRRVDRMALLSRKTVEPAGGDLDDRSVSRPARRLVARLPERPLAHRCDRRVDAGCGLAGGRRGDRCHPVATQQSGSRSFSRSTGSRCTLPWFTLTHRRKTQPVMRVLVVDDEPRQIAGDRCVDPDPDADHQRRRVGRIGSARYRRRRPPVQTVLSTIRGAGYKMAAT